MSNTNQYPSVTHPRPTHTTIIYKHSDNTNKSDNFVLAIARLEKAVSNASINLNTASDGMNDFLNRSLPKINSMFSEYETNIEVILTKVKNTDFVALSNQNGMELAQQQLDAYKINDCFMNSAKRLY